MATKDKQDDEEPPGKKRIFIKQFKHAKTGKIIRAADYGKDAFCILVRA